MTGFYIYIIGFFVAAVLYYLIHTTSWGYDIAANVFNNYEDHTKSYWAYTSLKVGILSWVTVIWVVIFLAVYGILAADDIIKEKLDKR